MKEFKLAVRQFAIDDKIELKIVNTHQKRFTRGCKAEGYPWHIIEQEQLWEYHNDIDLSNMFMYVFCFIMCS